MHERDERGEAGAVLVLAAVALVMFLSALTLVIDLGRLYQARAALQLQADAAALSAAMELGECAATPNLPDATADVVAQRNGFAASLGTAPSSVEYGTIASSAGVRSFDVSVDLASARAVRVVAVSEQPLSLVLPGELTGTVALRSESVARARAIGTLRAGTRLVAADAASPETIALLDDLLGGMLGSGGSVSAIGYDGLANSSLQVAELVGQLGSSSGISDLVEREGTVGEFYSIIEAALTAAGESDLAADVADLVAAATAARVFRFGEVLEVAVSQDALGASLNVLDLVLVGAQAAAKGSGVQVSPLSLSLAGVAGVDLTLVVVEPAQLAVGPPGRDADGEWRTQARTAQLRLQLDLTGATPLTVIGTVPVTLSSYATIARGSAALASIQCRRAADPATLVAVEAESEVGELGLGSYGDIETGAGTSASSVAQLSVLGVPVASVSVSGATAIDSKVETLEFEGPFVPWIDMPSPTHTQTAGTDLEVAMGEAVVNLVNDAEVSVTVLGTLPVGVSAGDIEAATEPIVTTLVAALDDAYAPLFEILAGSVAGIDVTLESVVSRRPTLIR